MEICKVVGCITSTAKDARLAGFKLLIVEPILLPVGMAFVAVDMVGAGVGELVLVAKGSAARESAPIREIPIDSSIMAIIDPGQSDPGFQKIMVARTKE